MGPVAVLRRTEEVMGTGATVELHDPVPAGRVTALVDDVFSWLREVDHRFSTYRADSEVNRLDRGELRHEDCSDDLRAVLAECARLWSVTDGFFDAYATGRLDPSGYVKGWSIGVASRRLTAAGVPNHLIDAGGDLYAAGRPGAEPYWRVGVRHPWRREAVCWVVAATDLAVATSGTYERGLHVVDPRTGRPARDLASVTVVGPDPAVADAYATAALAMGWPALRWLAGLPGYEAAAVGADRASFVSARFPSVPRDADPEP